MARLPNANDLTTPELAALRLVVARSFMSQSSMPAEQRDRLIELGLIQRGMGGLMPTPSGRICARMP